MSKLMWISALALALCAWSAHDPLIVANTTDVKPATAQHYPARTGPVPVVEGPLPASVKFEPIGDIDIGKVWYGASDKVLQELANRARARGADAVIEAKTWHQPSGYSWASPHGHGRAVKILNPEEIQDPSVLGKMLQGAIRRRGAACSATEIAGTVAEHSACSRSDRYCTVLTFDA